MPKVFFSHASEDKGVVEAVYAEFVVAHPEHEPWVDMYEIVGGESLLDKIAGGRMSRRSSSSSFRRSPSPSRG